jgi:hypothetical protein
MRRLPIDAMAKGLYDEAIRQARLQLDQSPDTKELRRRHRGAIEVGIRAGINGALLTLVEAGILPGAFEDEK